MSKSLGYYTFTGTQAVTADATLPLTTTTRQFGKNIILGNNSAIIRPVCGCNAAVNNSAGYYTASVNATLAASAAGAITVRLYQDGTPVSGAVQTVTATAAADNVGFSFSAPVRVFCNQTSTLSIVVSGQNVTASNVALEVVKE